MDVFFRGGPYPWFGQPLDHFIKGEFTYKSAIYSVSLLELQYPIEIIVCITDVSMNKLYSIPIRLMKMIYLANGPGFFGFELSIFSHVG